MARRAPTYADADRDSRYRWSVAAAVTLIQSLSPDGLAELVNRGEDEFTRIARRAYRSQDFQPDDFHRIFLMLQQRAAIPQHRAPVIH